MKEIAVIGGGLAGCEAAAQIARAGGRVILYEMKPLKFSPAHRLSGLAELVCSNSLKSDSLTNASGLLKEEMRRLSSLIVLAAEAERVPAGGSLSVDRLKFSSFITGYLEKAGVRIVREEIRRLPDLRPLIIATGPLTSDAFADELRTLLGKENLYFYDAISPVVFSDCVDFNIAFMGSRYNKGGPDYVNCPMDRTLYERFVDELLSAGKTPLRPFENIPFFEGCMPVEALAERGKKTLSFGPLKPVGIIDPRSKRRPYAVVQLRKENIEGTLYNMVGFQTRLLQGEQKRVFSLIPGLEKVRFARYGSIHRNSYMDSPRLLTKTLQMEKEPSIFFAGQITGVEGYCESAASGIIAGINAWRFSRGLSTLPLPPETMTGALLNYITGPERADFQPMNANFGLIKESGDRTLCVARALKSIEEWKNKTLESFGGI